MYRTEISCIKSKQVHTWLDSKFQRNGTGSKGLNELRTKQDLAVLLTRKISMAPINPDLGVPLTRKISMAPTMYMDDATVVPR